MVIYKHRPLTVLVTGAPLRAGLGAGTSLSSLSDMGGEDDRARAFPLSLMLAVFTLLSDRDISFCASVREGRFRFPSNLLLTALGFAFAFSSKSAAKSVSGGDDD